MVASTYVKSATRLTSVSQVQLSFAGFKVDTRLAEDRGSFFTDTGGYHHLNCSIPIEALGNERRTKDLFRYVTSGDTKAHEESLHVKVLFCFFETQNQQLRFEICVSNDFVFSNKRAFDMFVKPQMASVLSELLIVRSVDFSRAESYETPAPREKLVLSQIRGNQDLPSTRN